MNRRCNGVLMKRWIAICLMSFAQLMVAGQGRAEEPRAETPLALRLYVEARVAEAAGSYREALDLYSKAHDLDPAQREIRVAYASLLSDLGLAGSAVELLDGIEELDWLGIRTRALALMQLATRTGERIEDAERDLRAALTERPDDPNVQLGLAQLLMRQGNAREAEELVRALRERRPGSGRLQAMHASLLREIGQQEAAAELFERCVDEPGVGQRCRQGLVEVLLELDDPGRAGQAMAGWLETDDLDGKLEAASLLLNGGRAQQALAVVEQVLAVEPRSVRARTVLVSALLSVGRRDEAALQLNRLIREDSNNTGLKVQLAWVEAQRGQMERSRRLLDQLAESMSMSSSSPALIQLCFTGAQVELLADRPLRAREWLKRLSEPTEAGPDYVRLLAATYRRAGDVETMADAVGEMLRLQPLADGRFRDEALAAESEFRFRAGQPDGLERLAPLLGARDLSRVLLGLSVLQRLERWDLVVDATNDALERFESQPTLQFSKAAALERMGDVQSAEALFLELVDEYPDDAASANYLGYMWADAGVWLEEAYELISRAVEMEPNSPAYLDSLGWVYYRLDRLEEALHWLGRAVELSQGDGTILAHKGEVLAKLGRRDEARQALQSALELGCEDPDRVRELLGELAESSP